MNNPDTIYISRRCQYCHELLILIHKHDSLRGLFNISDIDTAPFPNFINHVPVLVINGNKVMPGDELFKLCHTIVKEKEGEPMKHTVNEQQPSQNKQCAIQSSKTPNNSNENSMDQMCKLTSEGEDDISGFCFNENQTLVGFSSIDDSDIDMNPYESIHSDSQHNSNDGKENLDSIMQNKPPQSEFDKNYEKMLSERNTL